MEPLTNPRWERFAQGVAAGRSGERSYVEAGGKDGPGAHVSASRLLRNATVAARVVYLQREATAIATQHVIVTKEMILEGLLQNVRRAMQQVPVLDSNGDETGVWKYEGNVANKAFELLGKHLGMWSDVEMIGARALSSDDLRAAIAAGAARLRAVDAG